MDGRYGRRLPRHPSTEETINAYTLRENRAPRVDPLALWFWGLMREMEGNGVFDISLCARMEKMTDSMRDDCDRIIPQLRRWLN